MKNSLLLILLITGLFITGCRKDNDTLPPETQTGANTFGCLVNGKVFVPKGTDGYSGQNKNAYYQHIYSGPLGYVFILSATNYEVDPLTFLVLGLDSVKIIEGNSYQLTTGLPGNGGATYWIGNDYNKRYITNGGEMYFKKFDEVNRIASGTFWFNAENSFGEKVEVREGRFDVKFTR